ncbi:MAG: major capsid protein [Candidatus Thiodiazotropha endolucinida]
MATLGNKFVDLIDIYKRMEPDGSIADIIEMLKRMNGVVESSLAIECNNGTKHLTSVRGGLPSVAWGRLYKGIPQSKSRFHQVEDTTGFCEALSSVDQRILKRYAKDKRGAIRLSEAEGFIESMSQEMENKFFYGNTATTPEEFLGLAPRFNDLNAENGSQIIDAGGTGTDNTSVWFVTWGERQVHLLYPEGTKAGLQRDDKGEQRVTDENGDAYFVDEELFHWDIGVTVRNWKYVSRVANIDVSDLKDGSVDLYRYMRKALYRLANRRANVGRIAIYCNTDVLEALDALGTNSGTTDNYARLKPMEIQGREIDTYRKIPIYETDAIINTETRVT